MTTTKMMLQTGALALSLLATAVMAKVSPDEAAQLGTTLTPIGAVKAGNADGSIPAWNGGLPTSAGTVDSKGFLSDPFANEKPLFVITAANAEKYKDKLSAGQLAMFKRYPDTYKIPVYPTHRTAAAPADIYSVIKNSAVKTEEVDGGNGLAGFTDCLLYTSPSPRD